jgi:hypothetical protein
MTSLNTYRRVELFDPDAIRSLVRSGINNGLIKPPPIAKQKSPSMNADEIRSIVAAAKAAGALRPGVGPDSPAEVIKNGHEATVFDSVVTQWMQVDPGLAAHWLQNNFVNRPISQDTVNAYARDMVNGVWIPTHQGIAFNDRDHLIDGQHRLSAIVKSGVTVGVMVTFGLSSKIEGSEMTTMDAVDRGRTRSVADQLKIQHGLKDGTAIAGICASLGGLCFSARTKRLSVGQTLDIYRLFETSITWVIDNRPTENGLKSVGVLAAFAFAMAGFARNRGSDDPEDIAKLFRSLVTGDGLYQSMPLDHLRNFLLSDDAKLLSRGTNRGVAELVLQALFLQISDEPVDKLEPSQDGLNHFSALQADRVAHVAKMFEIDKTVPKS